MIPISPRLKRTIEEHFAKGWYLGGKDLTWEFRGRTQPGPGIEIDTKGATPEAAVREAFRLAGIAPPNDVG